MAGNFTGLDIVNSRLNRTSYRLQHAPRKKHQTWMKTVQEVHPWMVLLEAQFATHKAGLVEYLRSSANGPSQQHVVLNLSHGHQDKTRQDSNNRWVFEVCAGPTLTRGAQLAPLPAASSTATPTPTALQDEPLHLHQRTRSPQAQCNDSLAWASVNSHHENHADFRDNTRYRLNTCRPLVPWGRRGKRDQEKEKERDGKNGRVRLVQPFVELVALTDKEASSNVVARSQGVEHYYVTVWLRMLSLHHLQYPDLQHLNHHLLWLLKHDRNLNPLALRMLPTIARRRKQSPQKRSVVEEDLEIVCGIVEEVGSQVKQAHDEEEVEDEERRREAKRRLKRDEQGDEEMGTRIGSEIGRTENHFERCGMVGGGRRERAPEVARFGGRAGEEG
ncbi:hypothetical protein BKA70DRAFT_1223594 [Coprinopsis sp. MPI-PUGE-AT-0042]|nr:hypothetical protein BKA70DRAFT_1223594 [Coprinopsis sp. MPI-PUGE-AT-0042]